MTGRQKMIIAWTVLNAGTIIVWVVGFAVMEGYAVSHEDAITLSRLTWEVDQSWPVLFPLLAYVTGAVQWGFIVHIKWHWDPTNPDDRRG